MPSIQPKPFIPDITKPTPRNDQVRKYVIGAVCLCSLILIGGVSALSSGKLPHVPKIAVLVGTMVFGSGGFIGCYIVMKKVKTIDAPYLQGESRGYTTLSYAVKKEQMGAIKRALWFGASPFVQGKGGTALEIALAKDENRRQEILDLFRGYNYDVSGDRAE